MEDGTDIEASGRPDPRRGIPVGTPEQFRWLHGIVKAVLVLNVIDAILTLVWVRAGLATEANTLIDELVNENALGFVAIKVGLVALGSWVLWRRRRHPFAVIGIFVVFLAYYGILLYHLRYASTLIRNTLQTG
ncbi:MAG TPA: hypothetical protein ENI85_19935 [Deltaproteobacteria bacterium]|nr:hypothetical protein [Deltaproteobacteria bacterium]